MAHRDELPMAPAAALPLLYAEDDLQPLATAPLQGRVPSLVGELLGASDAEQRHRLVRDALQAIGFDWLGYGTVAQQQGHAVPTRFFTGYAHAGWLQRYFAQRYHEVDARHQDAPTSSLPLIWDIDELGKLPSAQAAAGRQREFLDDFRDSGIRSGIFFRLASPTRANEHTVISLLSATEGRGWIVDNVLGRALTLGLSVHEYLSRHVRLPEAEPVAQATPLGQLLGEMSPTQQHILEELQQGRSDKEIAYRLHLTAHAVDYHMRQLRRRFAARNRVQLVNASAELRPCPGAA
jgi:DNA-binding CsgD family transcriptional regulator